MSIVTIPSSVPYDSNIFLIEGERPILVDSGTGQDSGTVIGRIREVCPDGPSMIVATHCHYDHAGGLHDLVEEFGCPVYAGWRDAQVIRNPDRRDVSALFGAAMRPVDAKDLREGDVLDTGSRRFSVLETPGHTEGSICLYDEESGTLISGDTLFLGGYGRTDFMGGSFDSMLASLVRLSKLDIRELFPGHGSTCESYTPGMMAEVLRMAGV